MPDLFTLAPTAAPSLLLRTIESFTINVVLEFVATGVTSHADFDDDRFEAAFAESIDVAPSLVNVTQIMIDGMSLTRGPTRLLLQANATAVLEIKIAVFTEDESVVENVQAQMDNQDFGRLLQKLEQYNVFPHGSQDLTVKEGAFTVNMASTYICSVHHSCKSCLSESFLHLGGDAKCSWCQESVACMNAGVTCFGESLQSSTGTAGVCEQDDSSLLGSLTFDILYLYAAAGAIGVVFVAVSVRRTRHRSERQAENRSGVVGDLNQASPQLAEIHFDDLFNHLHTQGASAEELFDPDLLPPLFTTATPHETELQLPNFATEELPKEEQDHLQVII
jgi:hypothetical protein